MMTCIIIEDEPLATDKLAGFINKVPFLHLLGEFDQPLKGMEFLHTHAVDLIFLDIQMEQLTGIQLLESLNRKPYVIITSAYAEYALKGYELNVFDYLLKPYSFDRFLAAVNKAYEDMLQKQNGNGIQKPVFIKTEYRLEQINPDDILFVEGMREYLRIHLSNKKVMTKMSFKDLMKLLPSDRFIQVHKSWVVALPKIETIERNRIKISGQLIPLGDTFREEFWKHING